MKSCRPCLNVSEVCVCVQNKYHVNWTADRFFIHTAVSFIYVLIFLNDLLVWLLSMSHNALLVLSVY